MSHASQDGGPGDAGDAGPEVLPPGTRIAGKYVVERVLGKGGMGIVVAARHLQLRDEVALKFLHGEMARKPAVVARFEREARAVVRIKSEHVARVIDVGQHEGAPFIVMEMLAGTDLHKLSAVRGPLPFPEAALYLAQACEAVAEAHRHGIIHRDLKPANLFLTTRPDGSPLVKVLDFGISKMLGEVDENLTATTDVLGLPLYMSPEQIESPRDVDARTDVWALGAILYKLLTGRAAFAAPTAASSLAKIVKDPPPPLLPQRPDLPPELEALVLRCLEKDVQNRVPSAADLSRALLPFTPGGTPGGAPETTAPGAAYSRPAAPAQRRSRRPAAMLAVGLATVLGGALALWLVRPAASTAAAHRDAASPSSSPTPPPPPAAVPLDPPAVSGAPSTVPAAASSSATPPRPARPARLPSTRGSPSDAFSDRL